MPKTYDRHTAAFLAKVAENMPILPAAVMQGLMKNPQMLKQVLAELHPWKGQLAIRFACSRVKRHEKEMLNEIRNNVYLAIWGRKLFDAAFPDTPTDTGGYFTVRLKLRQLGFTERVTLRDFKKRALQFGLTECPLFVAYHYRLRYTNQPLNETLYILTKSVDIGNGELSLFGLSNREFAPHPAASTPEYKTRLWLDGHEGSDDGSWNPDSEFVFALKQ